MNTRSHAAKMLAAVIEDGQSLTTLHRQAEDELEQAELSHIKYLTFVACRFFYRYQAVLDQLMEKPFKAKDSDILALVVMGMHDLTLKDKADHAAINETVEAVRALKKEWASKLVNALLRQWQRMQSEAELPWESDIRFESAHPGWIAKRIRKAWPDNYASIENANNCQAPMTIRVNRLQTTRNEYLEKLAAVNILATPTQMSPDGIQLEKPCSVNDLPGFASGMCSVQDEAAQLAAVLLDAKPTDYVLDACCAPGGKTGHILETGVQRVIGVDADAQRLTRVQENLSRLNLDANLIEADLSKSDWWDGTLFDRILLDAPCSATGVIRRHPDIKLLRRPSDIAPLVELQGQIFAQLWSMLKPGGILVYATCSILPIENHLAVAQFLAEHPDAKQQAMLPELDAINGQLLPKEQGHDGFFYAKLLKTESGI